MNIDIDGNDGLVCKPPNRNGCSLRRISFSQEEDVLDKMAASKDNTMVPISEIEIDDDDEENRFEQLRREVSERTRQSMLIDDLAESELNDVYDDMVSVGSGENGAAKWSETRRSSMHTISFENEDHSEQPQQHSQSKKVNTSSNMIPCILSAVLVLVCTALIIFFVSKNSLSQSPTPPVTPYDRLSAPPPSPGVDSIVRTSVLYTSSQPSQITPERISLNHSPSGSVPGLKSFSLPSNSPKQNLEPFCEPNEGAEMIGFIAAPVDVEELALLMQTGSEFQDALDLSGHTEVVTDAGDTVHCGVTVDGIAILVKCAANEELCRVYYTTAPACCEEAVD